jgi:hypothetical protein
MENLAMFLIVLANAIFDHAGLFLSSFFDGGFLSAAGGGLTFAFALGVVTSGGLTESILAGVRRWHGSIDDQFSAIDNLVNVLEAHHMEWMVPPELFTQLNDDRNILRTLISKCRSTAGSPADRAHRNVVLKSAVGLCLLHVRLWAYGQFETGVITDEDVHLLGFLLPGEASKHNSRTEATRVMAEVKVRVLSADLIRVVIDQSAGENAAQVVRGWPNGVKNALIVIVSADTKTEVVRHMTTHLHNDIQMPDGSQGKQFLIKAAFLKHVDDTPHFGNEPSFSMPLTTEDLIHTLDRQHHEDFEEQLRETERHRQETERLQEELKVKSEK